MTSTMAPLRMTVMASGRPIASANISRCRSCARGDRAAARAEQQVAGMQPGSRGRAAGDHLGHPQALAPAEPLPHRGRHRGGDADQAEVGPADPAVADQGAR